MVQQLLLAVSVIVLALGVVDYLQTREDQSPPAVAAESIPYSGMGHRYVRINGFPAGYKVLYRYFSEASRRPLDFPFTPYGRSAASRHVIVDADTPVQITEDLAARARERARIRARLRDPRRRQVDDEPPPPTPKPPQQYTFGLLSPLPPGFKPRDATASFPAGASISVLDATVEPPALQIPAFIFLAGLIGAYFLTSAAEDPRSAETIDDPAWKPFHRIEPATGEALTYAAVATMLAALLAVPRYLRLGGPHLYDNQVLTLFYGVAALCTGYTAFRRETNKIGLSSAGVDIENAPPAQRRIPWAEFVEVRREKPQAGGEHSYELVLRTARYRSVRLELPDEDGELAASHVAAIMARCHLAKLRMRLQCDERVEFDGLVLRRDKFSFEHEGRDRTIDYKDLERITIAKGVMGFRLLAGQWDVYTCHYQELPNGIYLPEILPSLIQGLGNQCTFSWHESPLEGADAWLANLARRAAVPAAADTEEPAPAVIDPPEPASAVIDPPEPVAPVIDPPEPVADVILAARASNNLACYHAAEGRIDDALDVLDAAIVSLENAAAAGPLRFDTADTDRLFTNVLTILSPAPAIARQEVHARIVDFYRAAAPESPSLAAWLEAQARVSDEPGPVSAWLLAPDPMSEG